MTRVTHLLILACASLLVTGCSLLAPKYERPAIDIPASWSKVKLSSLPLNVDWWQRFNDPVLTALIEEALKYNQDLAESLARVESAAAKAGVNAANMMPNSYAAAGSSSQGASEKTANTKPFSESGLNRSTYTNQGSLNASWELDLFGRYYNTYRMMTNVMLATVVSHEALRLSVARQTAESYFVLLALDMQLNTARRTLKTREEAFRIYSSRYKQGDITELDWQRARAEVETARAQVHTSTIAVDQAEASLAVLLGRSPRDIMERGMERGKAIAKLPAPPVLPEGLPSQLLWRRPDIRAAEYSLMGSNANIGAARAAFFPSISLTGMLGTVSAGVGSLFTGPAGAFSYGVSGQLPLLDFGRNWYNLKDAHAQKEAAIAAYRKSVQAAFMDVRTSLTAQRETDAIVKSMQVQVDSLRRAVDIARLQYENGYTDYLTVLDAARQLFASELQLATALRDRLSAVVAVCMALGGGWDDPGNNGGFAPFMRVEELVQEKTSAGKLQKKKQGQL